MMRWLQCLRIGFMILGDKNDGSDASTGQASLIGVDRIYTTRVAFPAVLMDGKW